MFGNLFFKTSIEISFVLLSSSKYGNKQKVSVVSKFHAFNSSEPMIGYVNRQHKVDQI